MKRRVLGMLLLLALWMTAGMAEQGQLVAKVTAERRTLKLRA